MMKEQPMTGYASALACFLILVFSVPATATPYASGIQVNGSSSSFILNEGDANVSIVYDGGATVIDMGTLAAGSHTFNAGLGSSWQIVCSKTTEPGWVQISDDTTPENQYSSPRGVAVNRNPNSSNFGRIYVSNALSGAVTTIENGRYTDMGLFVLGADSSDILDQFGVPETGGIDWDSASGASPWKLTIAPDNSVYIADWSDSHSGVWRCDADPQFLWDEILDNTGRDASGLTSNHGSVAATWVEGTGADTVLYTLDEDWPDAGGAYGGGRGDVNRYDIGTETGYFLTPEIQVEDGTNSAGNPSASGLIINGNMDFVRDEDGSWWLTQYRWTEGPDDPSLMRFEDGGTGPIYRSDTDDNLSPLTAAYGNIDIHNELDMLIMGAHGGYGVYIIDISDPDNPVLADTIIHGAYITRDVSFDAAGNIYIVSDPYLPDFPNDSQRLRIYSPGGSWVTKTGSDGSFILQSGSEPVDSADFDGDGDVDGADFLAWQVGFGIDSGATVANGDANGDGAVDSTDLTIWQAQFGTTSGNLAGTPVPEPSSILIVLAGLACLGCYRRRTR